MEELKTYLEMRIRECNCELEKNYQGGTDIIRMARLEERIKTLKEVQLFVNRKIPEANKKQIKRKKLNEKIKKMENTVRMIDDENEKAVLEASKEAMKETVDWILNEINPIGKYEEPFLIAALRTVADVIEYSGGGRNEGAARKLYYIASGEICEITRERV